MEGKIWQKELLLHVYSVRGVARYLFGIDFLCHGRVHVDKHQTSKIWKEVLMQMEVILQTVWKDSVVALMLLSHVYLLGHL